MAPIALFGITVLFSFISWSLVAAWYIWPELRRRPRAEALRPLLLLHSFRFIGLAFLVGGVVSADLPAGFAHPAAYGDAVAAVLALLTFGLLETRLGAPSAWVFNIWGAADLLYGFYTGYRFALQPGQLGATYLLVAIPVPLLLVTHALAFRLLTRRYDSTSGSAGPVKMRS